MAEEYFIIGVKSFRKSVSRTCVTCQKALAKTQDQQMGMLPLNRTQPSPVFSIVGVDFAGPFTVRRGNPRRPSTIKVYICLFVCLSTRAIHLESCEDLSTDGFWIAFHAFTAARGKPSIVYSDNGTNFRGAHNELSDLYQFLSQPSNQEKIAIHVDQDRIQWNFNPPRTPHFGGLWEAGVRIMKATMKKILPSHPLYLTLSFLNCLDAHGKF